jgi:uncharacterized protein YneF (UPF0154 family)
MRAFISVFVGILVSIWLHMLFGVFLVRKVAKRCIVGKSILSVYEYLLIS